MKVVSLKREINAPIEKVWKIMTSVHEYPKWNPFIVHVDCEYSIATYTAKMKFHIKWYDGSTTTSNETVTVFDPPDLNQGESANWEYIFDSFLSSIGMVKAHRFQRLSFKDGITTYETAETFTGWGTLFLPINKIRKGFEDQADALKKFCEG